MKLKITLLSIFVFISSGCVTLSEEGSKVKIISPYPANLEKMQSCQLVEKISITTAGTHPTALIGLKNAVANAGGNVLVSKLNPEPWGIFTDASTSPATGNTNVTATSWYKYQGVAYKCTSKVYDLLVSEEDY